MYAGKISDEGVSGIWRGEANLYPTVESYVKDMQVPLIRKKGEAESVFVTAKAARDYLYRLALEAVPEGFRSEPLPDPVQWPPE